MTYTPKTHRFSTYSLMSDKCIHSCHQDPNQECSLILEISSVLLAQTATATISVAMIGFAALEFYIRAIPRFLVPAGLGCCTDQSFVPFNCSVCSGAVSPSVGWFPCLVILNKASVSVSLFSFCFISFE